MAQHSKSHPQVDPGTAQQAAADHDDMIVVPKGQSRIQFFLILGLFIFILVIFTVGPFVQQVLGGLFQGAGPNAVYFSWVHPTTGETTELNLVEFQRRMKALDVLKQLGFYVPTAARDGDDPRADVTEAETAIWIILDRLAQDRGIEVTPADLRERIEMSGYQSVANYQMLLRQYREQGFGVSAAEIESHLASWMRAELYASFLQSTLAVADPAAVEKAWADDPNNVEYAFDYVTLAAKEFTDAAKAEDPSDETLLDWLRAKPEHEQRHFRTDDRIVAEVAWIPLEQTFDPTPLLAKFPTPASWDEAAEAQRYYNQFSHMRFRMPQDETPPPEPGEGESADDAPAADEGEGDGGAPATGDAPPADEDGATSDDDGAASDEDGAASDDGGDGESQGGPFAADALESGFAQDDRPAPEDQEGAAESPPPADADANADAQDADAQDADATDAATTPQTETDEHAGHDHADGETNATVEEPPKLYRPFEEVEATCRKEARWKRALDDWLADLAARAQAGETIDLAAEAEALGLAYERTSEPRSREQLEKAEGWGSPLVVGGLFFVQSGNFTRQVQVQEGAMVLGRQIEKVAGVERPIDEIRDRLLEHWIEQRAVALAVERLEAIRSTFPVPPPEEGAAEDEVVIESEDAETSGEDAEATGEDAVASEDEETPAEEEEALPTADRETFTAAVEAAGLTVVQRPYLRRFSYPNDDFSAATPGDHHIRTETAYHELEEGQVAAPRASTDHTAAYLVRFAGQRVAPIETMKPADLEGLRAEAAHEAKTAFAKRYLRGDSPEVRRKFKIYLGSVDAPREEPAPAAGSAR